LQRANGHRMVTASTQPTKSQVNKAGRTVRKYLVEQLPYDHVLDQALDVVLAHRAAHQYPLGKANMGLRSILKTVGCSAVVSQRLKRFVTILDKLEREPTMQLANMQDIGGCRAVLDSVADLRRVEARIRRNRDPIRVYDYIVNPRDSGYRGVHLVVCYQDREGEDRVVEVQLRTHVMHEWAIFVERQSGRIGEDLKSGRGPEEVLDFLRVASEAMALDEREEAVPEDLLRELAERRARAVPFLGGRP